MLHRGLPGGGVAPTHSTELTRYRAGLPDGEDLWDWMCKNAKRYMIEFRAHWDDGCISPCDDD